MTEIEKIIPKLGLGDLFTLKRYCLDNNLKYKKIIINSNAIKWYKNTNNPNNYIDFISKFIKNLFHCDVEVCDLLNPNLLEDPLLSLSSIQLPYKIKITSKNIILDKHYIFEKDFNIDHGLYKNNYIVFHTKVRNDNSKNFINTKKLLPDFFINFKSRMVIVIIGERLISKNIESDTNDFHCIYDDLMLMKKNNNLIDLTQEGSLNDGNINYELFESDLNYIKNAYRNVIFGIGGPLSLSVSLIYMEKETYNSTFKSIIKSIESENNLIFTQPEELFKELNKF
jgi:hypothetical protein